VGGIIPAEPGFKRISLNPHGFTQLSWASVTHDTPYGVVRSEWRSAGGFFEWDITIPANTTATVRVPARSADTVTEGRRRAGDRTGVVFKRFDKGRSIYEVTSGTFKFRSRL
jgi:alpha-L-rhamnosidase